MGCCPGAGGDTLAVTESEPIQQQPTKGADWIVMNLMEHFHAESVEEMLSKAMVRFGLNDQSWAAEVRRTHDRFIQGGILPKELIALHAKIIGYS